MLRCPLRIEDVTLTIRLATFNVENLFARAKALDTATQAEGGPALAAFGQFNTLAAKTIYTPADKQAMLQALETLEVLVRSDAGRLVLNPSPVRGMGAAAGEPRRLPHPTPGP
ncbi:hypothetical protein AB0H12_44865 [Actinosynnema sp. NPDC023794]